MPVFLFTVPGWSGLVDLVTEGLRFFYQLTGNVGWGIVLFTIVVKTVLIPLTLPALRNARRQQELAPMVREIIKKHGNDRVAASQEQMALYRQYGFNPMSGCLPSLVQLPIFFALYSAITQLTGTPLGQQGFLWISHISQADPWRILPIIAAVAQFFQTRMSMQSRSRIVDPQQRQMNMIIQFMPLVVLVSGFAFPAGAVLYWAVSAVYSAVVQYFVSGWNSLTDIFPFLPRREPKSLLGAPKPVDPNAKPSRFQKFQEKMAEAQRQQEEEKRKREQGGDKKQAAAPRATVEPALVKLDEVSAEGNRFSEDGWRLPGAPGTQGRTAFAAGTSGGGATQQPRAAQNRSRSNGRNGNRKKRK